MSKRQKQIERAVGHIERELREDRTPSLESIANAAGLSAYHFHRIFKLMTGETCAQAITRLKLAQSTPALRDPQKAITDAAMTAGYSSSQAYSKAFKRVLLDTPTQVKDDPERLDAVIKALLEPECEGSDPPAKIRIGSLEPLEILVMSTVGEYPNLIETYGALYDRAGGPDSVHAALGIFAQDIDLASGRDFEFDAAIVPRNVALDGTSRLGRADYAIIQHTGADAEIPTTLDTLYSAILAQADTHFRDAPYLFHYIDDPEFVDEDECRIDLYIPISRVEGPKVG